MTDIRNKPLLPPTRSQLTSDWRRNFITDATVKVLSLIRGRSDDEVRREIRGAVGPLKASDFPGDSVTRFVALSPPSTIAQLAPLSTRIDTPGVSVTVPSGNWVAAEFVAEGAPIPIRQEAFSGLSLGQIKKLALMTAWSRELEYASGGAVMTIMSSLIEDAIRRGADGIFLSDSAATDIAPAGILVGAATVTGSASPSADLGALVAKITEAGIDSGGIAFVCAPSQAISLSLQAGPHFRHKIIESSTLEDGTVVAVATGGLIFAGEGTPTIDVSKQALVQMGDPASHISTAGAPPAINPPVVSTFQADLIALRIISRITWLAMPGAVAVCTGSAW